ncbi:MAG: hypothetical protein ACKVOR_01590 [Flavobacteriales bacterium]
MGWFKNPWAENYALQVQEFDSEVLNQFSLSHFNQQPDQKKWPDNISIVGVSTTTLENRKKLGAEDTHTGSDSSYVPIAKEGYSEEEYQEALSLINEHKTKTDVQLSGLLGEALNILVNEIGRNSVIAFLTKKGTYTHIYTGSWQGAERTEISDYISQQIKSNYYNTLFNSQITLSSKWLETHRPHFTSVWDFMANTQAFMTFGGIQELEIRSTNIDVTHQNATIGRSGSTPESIKADVNYDVFMKDWFGVDWTDIVGDFAALLGGDGLAAFWILQHHRGYPPVKNILLSKEFVQTVIK